MCDKLVKRLHRYSENVVAYKLDADFASAVQEAADAIEQLSNAGSAYGRGWTLGYDAGREENKPRWIPVTERLPDDFVSVQAHMTDAGPFPSVREGYVINGEWFFPALNEFHPVDKWTPFMEPEAQA